MSKGFFQTSIEEAVDAVLDAVLRQDAESAWHLEVALEMAGYATEPRPLQRSLHLLYQRPNQWHVTVGYQLLPSTQSLDATSWLMASDPEQASSDEPYTRQALELAYRKMGSAHRFADSTPDTLWRYGRITRSERLSIKRIRFDEAGQGFSLEL